MATQTDGVFCLTHKVFFPDLSQANTHIATNKTCYFTSAFQLV